MFQASGPAVETVQGLDSEPLPSPAEGGRPDGAAVFRRRPVLLRTPILVCEALHMLDSLVSEVRRAPSPMCGERLSQAWRKALAIDAGVGKAPMRRALGFCRRPGPKADAPVRRTGLAAAVLARAKPKRRSNHVPRGPFLAPHLERRGCAQANDHRAGDGKPGAP